jgi:hypothetical protein
MINAYTVLVGKPERSDHLEDLGVDRITLKHILKRHGVREWTGFI